MFTFGIPKQTREVKVEKYPNTPVLTMRATTEDTVKGFGFEINSKLRELLGLTLNGEEKVSIAIQDGVARIAVTTGRDVEQYLVRKNGSFSNKPIYQYVAKSLALNTTKDNVFSVEFDTTQDGINIYQLNLI